MLSPRPKTQSISQGNVGDEGKAATGQAKSRKSVPSSEVVEIPKQGTSYSVITCTRTFTLTTTAHLCPALSKSTTLDHVTELQLPVKAVLAEGSSQHYSVKPNAQQEMLPNLPSPR
jgi:hypothetical protein